MTRYDKDPEADAVVLCETGDVDFDWNGGHPMFIYRYLYRYKVLKDAGADCANVEIDYIFDDEDPQIFEEVDGIRATAYNQENGKTVKTQLNERLITDQMVDMQHRVKKFSIPSVKAGTVVEYSYTIRSHIFWQLRDYIAQQAVPVDYCSYRMEIPTMFIFNVEISTRPYFKGLVTNGTFKVNLNDDPKSTSNISCKTNIYTIIGQEMPAVKDDEWLWSASDYAAHVTCELHSYMFPGQPAQTVTKDWQQVDKQLLQMDEFGPRLNDNCKFADELTAAGIPQITDFKKKVSAAFTLLMKKVSWDGRYRFYPVTAGELLRKRQGSNADINMVFISECNSLGIKAYPVVLRTRHSGALPQNFPSLSKFNTWVVAVTDGLHTYYIDASSADGYLNVLQPNLYVTNARAIRKGQAGQWVDLQQMGLAKTTTQVDYTLTADGSAQGKVTTIYIGNAAANKRQAFAEAKDSADYVATMGRKSGTTIGDYHITGLHAFVPEMTETFTVTQKGKADGQIIYVNVFPDNLLGKNPFAAPSRNYPVEFPYRMSTTYVVKIQAPEGYVVDDQPQTLSIRTEDNAISGQVSTSPITNGVSVIYRFNINKLKVEAAQYASAKQLFEKMEQVGKAMVVFKKAQ